MQNSRQLSGAPAEVAASTGADGRYEVMDDEEYRERERACEDTIMVN